MKKMKDSCQHHSKKEDSNPNYKLPCCYLHPKEVLIGVCPRCLNERLVILAAAAASSGASASKKRHGSVKAAASSTAFRKPKIFAFGSLLHRLELGCRKPGDVSGDEEEDDDRYTSTSLDDSFISIKFEENGLVSWDKSRASRGPQDPCDASSNWLSTQNSTKEANKNNRVVVEHAKSHGPFRRRIAKLIRLIRCKRANSTRVESKVQEATARAVKLRTPWIKTLKRQTRPKI